MRLTEIAIRFTLSSPDVTIPGARNAAQARSNIEAMARGPPDPVTLDETSRITPFGGGRGSGPRRGGETPSRRSRGR